MLFILQQRFGVVTMKSDTLTKGLTVVFLMTAIMTPVYATTLGTADLVSTHMGASQAIDIYGAGYSGQEIYAGVYMLTKSAGSGVSEIWDNGDNIAGFCIEAEEPYPNTVTHYDLVTTESATVTVLSEAVGTGKAALLSELWGRYYDSSWQDGSYATTENNAASAFAAAVWEIIYEDMPSSSADYDVSIDNTIGLGGFASTTVDEVLANSWLQSLDGTGSMESLLVFTADGSQNYLVAVPEPMTVLLLGMGGALSVARKRRRVVA